MRDSIRSYIIREGANIPPKGIDPYMFPSKRKSIKSLFFVEGVKKVGKVISKFFLFNVIPFNATNSGPYYQSMLDTIAEAGPGIKGPMGYQIGNAYLEEEVQYLEVYINTLKAKWTIYGCTIMCDGWNSRTRKCETPENSDFLREDKTVISVKIQKFSRSQMTKRTSPLESSCEI